MPTTQSLKVKKLSLDTRNFRTVPQPDEASAIHPLISLDPDYFWALMASLIDNGYLPTESIIVLKEGRALVVKEGNRRVAALKIIHGIVSAADYDLPADLTAKLSKLSSDWKKVNEAVPCLVYEAAEAEAADRVVALTHGKGQKAGRLDWESIATARHNREKLNISEPGLDLLEKYLAKGKNLTRTQAERWAGKYHLTVLDDAIKKLAGRLGFKSAAELASSYPKVSNKASLDALMLDIGLGHLGFKETRADDFGATYGLPPPPKTTATSSSTGSGPSSHSNSGTNIEIGSNSGASDSAQSTGSSKAGASTGASASSGTTKSIKAHAAGDPKAVAAALRSFKPRGKNREKLVTLLDELKKLKIRDHPHAFCFLLRSMFEISAKAYCKDQAPNGPSATKADGTERFLVDILRDVIGHLTKNKTDKGKLKELQGAMTQLGKSDSILSVTSMNQLVHNPKFLISAHDICTLFANVFPLLEEMNK